MDHMNKGGSYVIDAEGKVKLIERGDSDPVVNAAVVNVPEHEAEAEKAKHKTGHKDAKKAHHGEPQSAP